MNALAGSATSTDTFFDQIRNPVKFRLFLMRQLPAAFFSGVKIRNADAHHALVTVPYRWQTRNPFRSTYFACLSMAAEMSTGILAMAHLYRRQPKVALLVVAVEGKFYKKATGITLFTCRQGVEIKNAIEAAVATDTPQTVRALASGTNEAGEAVAEFWITWSFKARR